MEAYRRMVDGLEVWRQQDVILLDMTNTVDYDQGAYAQLLEEMVGEKQEVRFVFHCVISGRCTTSIVQGGVSVF